jgi:hypothetical protein
MTVFIKANLNGDMCFVPDERFLEAYKKKQRKLRRRYIKAGLLQRNKAKIEYPDKPKINAQGSCRMQMWEAIPLLGEILGSSTVAPIGEASFLVEVHDPDAHLDPETWKRT